MNLILASALALAQSPVEQGVAAVADSYASFLAEEAPRAEELLARCAVAPCADEEAAQAAWILAMDTYTAAGVADGQLAATVAVLSAELFDTFPDVLQASATQPLAWALPGEPAVPPEPLTEVQTASVEVPAEPRAPVYLTIEVVDGEGLPVQAAYVRFPLEEEAHRAHTQSGRWTSSRLYLPSGEEYPFVKRGALQFDVWAPGYRYQKVHYVLTGRRKSVARIVLREGAPGIPSDPGPLGLQAFEAHERWVAAELAYARSNDAALEGEWVGARRALAETAREWLDAGGGAVAHELCLMTGSLAHCGQAP